MFDILVMFISGFIMGLVLDAVWWNIDYSKYEKGIEVLEHYHFGILLGMIGLLSQQPIFLGLMIAFILAEWTQVHQFAFGSDHFKNSTYIGIAMFIMFGFIYLV